MLIALMVSASLVSTAPAQPGPDARSVPLDAVFPFWTEFQSLEPTERDLIALTYRLGLPPHPDGGTYGLWLQRDSRTFEPIEANALDLISPPDDAAFQDDLQIISDAPAGQASISFEVELNLELAESYDIETLQAAIDQAQAAVRRLAGWRAAIMPRIDTVMFIFDGAAPDAELIGSDRDNRSLEEVVFDRVYLEPGQRRIRNYDRVEFGEKPVRVVLTAEG